MTRPFLAAICFIGLMSEPSSMSWPVLIGWSVLMIGCAVGFLWFGCGVKFWRIGR